MSASIPDLTQNRALHRDVEAYVVQMIRAGELRPGDRVNEAEVARRLQISRTPVREAFARLIKDNILEHLPLRGVFVASVSRDNVEEITSLRAVLEGFAARRACQRIAPPEIELLRQVVAEGAAAGDRGDWLTMEEKNAEFHDLLIAGAHHALLARVGNGAIGSLYAGYLLPFGRAGYEGAAYDQGIILRGTRGALRYSREGEEHRVDLESSADDWRAAPRQRFGFTLPPSPAYGGEHGLAITLIVLGMNFFADGLQDAIDPRRLR